MAPNGDDLNTDEDLELPPQGQSWDDPVHQSAEQGDVPATYDDDSPATTSDDEGLESDELLPVFLSFIPGVGQIMMGQTVKGLVMLGASFFCLNFFGLLTIASILDAYLIAKVKKKREVDDWEFFPEFKETFDL